MDVISEKLNLKKDIKKNKKVLNINKNGIGKEEEIKFKTKYEYEKYQFDS
jgi:hypothetical protein